MRTLYPTMRYGGPMVINPAEMGALEAYKLATSLIVPRPIAWVGTRSEDGIDNLAPFSYFMGVSTKPAAIAISVARGRGGMLKDTASNILATGDFTVSLVSYALVESMVASSLPWASEISEFEAAGIPLAVSDTGAAPRPASALATMECSLVHVHDMGTTHLFVGEVSRYHLDDGIVRMDAKGHRVVELSALDPVGRLGAFDYCRIREVFELKAQK